MSLLDAVVGFGGWLALGLAVYAAVAAVVLFYLPPAEELPSGAVADAAFVLTLPFVLALTWASTHGLRR